jgi:DNA replication and repair protein RecF
MRVERLELVDFRNYRHATLDLAPGVSVLVGPNAQGKTNLLEALHYLAIGGSHRVATDAPLVRTGAETAVLRTTARFAGGRRVTVELEVRPAGRNRAKVNGQLQSRTRDALGIVRSVLFAPEDLQLVRGDPGDRRRFLDDLLLQRRPAYGAARQEYERILRQRNALLRGLRAGRQGTEMLPTWTDALVRAGATLLAARIAAVHALAGPAAAAYRDLVATAPEQDIGRDVTMEYELSTGRSVTADPHAGVPAPAELAEELRAGVADVAVAERDRAMTLAGPHRDELFLGVGDLPAKGFASHGEQWSLALALRLASREVLHEVGEEPVVLLDDVFAELDAGRRRRHADRCTRFEQVVVTAAVDDDVPLEGPRSFVHAGTLVAAWPSADDGGSADERGTG